MIKRGDPPEEKQGSNWPGPRHEWEDRGYSERFRIPNTIGPNKSKAFLSFMGMVAALLLFATSMVSTGYLLFNRLAATGNDKIASELRDQKAILQSLQEQFIKLESLEGRIEKVRTLEDQVEELQRKIDSLEEQLKSPPQQKSPMR